MESRLSFLFLLFALFAPATPVPRDKRVLDVLQRHAFSLDKAVGVIRSCIPPNLLEARIPKFLAKAPLQNVPARELTIVDSSLGMVEAVGAALSLAFPSRGSRVDTVLQALVPIVSAQGVRRTRRQNRGSTTSSADGTSRTSALF